MADDLAKKKVVDEEEDEEALAVSCCAKYFCEGQILDRKLQEKIEEGNVLPWHLRYRKPLAMVIPFFVVHFVWWYCFIRYDSFHKFVNYSGKKSQYVAADQIEPNTKPWYMSITMIFGSMIAGATSEGGASVAFPVMTLIFDMKPKVAKQFSFLIQSVGMTAAAFVILFMKIQIEWKALVYCTVGGAVGVIYGLEDVAPELTPPYSKMYFVVIWGAFAASLFFLNRIHGRKVYLVLDPPHLPRIWRDADLVSNKYLALVLNWKALVLLGAGFLGGIFTSMSGSGIDICSFSVLTLFFRITEKTATPTSVVLMAINTLIATVYTKYFDDDGFHPLVWEFFSVCAPIVVIGAPLGSMISSFVHRLVLASFIYVTDTAQLVAALYVVRPWTTKECHDRPGGPDCQPLHLCWSSAAIFVSGLLTFYFMTLAGEKLIDRNDNIEEQSTKGEVWSKDGIELRSQENGTLVTTTTTSQGEDDDDDDDVHEEKHQPDTDLVTVDIR